MNGKSEAFYCLIGNPVSHSLSPVMHRAAFKAMNLNADYQAFLVHDLKGAVRCIRAHGIHGVSVTIPFKESVIPYLDAVDKDVRHIGAVNTILNQNGKLTGFNTDARGFISALQEITNPRGKRVVILGAGGAARAVAYALIQSGAEVIITNRTQEKAEKLASKFSCAFVPWNNREKMAADILVNTTSVGMYPQVAISPFDGRYLSQFELVVDIIYNPEETRLLKLARQAGAKTLGGIEMFIYQGAEQIRLWTGREPPLEVMRQAVKEALRDGS